MNRIVRPVLLALVALASGAALAQPKPALVQDRDEPGRNPYSETVIQQLDDAHCLPPGGPPRVRCFGNFTTVPAGKRLVVTYAAAWMYFANAGTFPVAYVMGGTSIMLMPAMTTIGNNLYQVGVPVTFYFEAGQTPRIQIEARDLDASSSLYLMLSGYYVNLP